MITKEEMLANRNAELEKELMTKNGELEIEHSLEKVRACALSMKEPADMLEVCKTISHQLASLGVKEIRNVQTAIFHEDKGTYMNYEYYAKHDKTVITQTSYTNNEIQQAFANQMLKGHGEFYMTHIKGDKIKDWIAFQKTTNVFIDEYLNTASSLNYYWYSLGAVALGISTYEPLKDEEINLFKRFLKVFELSYRRYLDIEQAEAQTRESLIQLALERVRSKTMAMHKSDGLIEIMAVMFEQLSQLHFRTDAITLSLEYKTNILNLWMAIPGQAYPAELKIPYTDIPVINKVIGAVESGNHFYSATHDFKEKNQWINHILEHTVVKYSPYDRKNFLLQAPGLALSMAMGKNIALIVANYAIIPFTDEENGIIKRFANVFEESYIRFLDLQKAEAQAREAQIEAALERVRSRTLAMQKSDELAETAAVLFKQLINLGISPNRLYIGIIHDDSGVIEFWITDEDGTKVSTMFSGEVSKNLSMQKMYEGWKTQLKTLMIDLQGQELADYFHYLGDELHVPFKDGLSQKRRIHYISFFSKGFIGMASPEEQPQETVDLLNRFAYVLNLTFTRFNDLKISEEHALQAERDLVEIIAARKKAEEALTELQATQRQLIQSEKMASLGELTAGIAHEIQNPLNFVNNFSEVSNELISEMVDEVEKGNAEEVKLIASDIKQNLEKINHHGKRADAIVKGMLQHSRKNEGQKEPTDINALCDEYLRLSYHGMRAKNKSFNAGFNSDFDNSIGKINIVPQDMGRVLLNLFNNAFYAVNKKKQKLNGIFDPVVSVSTKKENGNFVIKVADNGEGISEKILDKIFQPFFTTKPTGEGTGLGLSLSYDIIKTHGGDIKVETKEGEATTFIIRLPV